uniref:Uncharacterized protein n=1 Tax=Brassica oleracea var. oleracea TaxID=109376 RepID=A0A0D3DRM2_BRAOL
MALLDASTNISLLYKEGMEKGIYEIMISLAAKDGTDWLEYKKQLKRSEQRNVEVY